MLVLKSISKPNCSAKVFSAPVKPSANNAKSQSQVFSVSGNSFNSGLWPSLKIHSTSTVFKPIKFPFLSPKNSLVEILKKRSTPSLCDVVVFKRIGQYGQG